MSNKNIKNLAITLFSIMLTSTSITTSAMEDSSHNSSFNQQNQENINNINNYRNNNINNINEDYNNIYNNNNLNLLNNYHENFIIKRTLEPNNERIKIKIRK